MEFFTKNISLLLFFKFIFVIGPDVQKWFKYFVALFSAVMLSISSISTDLCMSSAMMAVNIPSLV